MKSILYFICAGSLLATVVGCASDRARGGYPGEMEYDTGNYQSYANPDQRCFYPEDYVDWSQDYRFGNSQHY